MKDFLKFVLGAFILLLFAFILLLFGWRNGEP
jgi:hypothetical protein